MVAVTRAAFGVPRVVIGGALPSGKGPFCCTLRPVDRFGLFVDAGYLLMAGGSLCVNAESRTEVVCDYAGIHKALVDYAADHCGLPVFRTYWYDGAPGVHRVPTTDHLAISRFRLLKLRLGRIIQNQQKGVDSMIYRDMTTLAREKAISVAYLLSGDEDLREGVVSAQDLGVQVFLLGVPDSNQSFTLINECDHHLLPDEEFWNPHFSRSIQASPSTAPALTIAVPADAETDDEDARSAGHTFCDLWLQSADPETAQLVLEAEPILPKDVDAPLLRSAEGAIGALSGREYLRRVVRNGFRERLRQILSTPDGTTSNDAPGDPTPPSATPPATAQSPPARP